MILQVQGRPFPAKPDFTTHSDPEIGTVLATPQHVHSQEHCTHWPAFFSKVPCFTFGFGFGFGAGPCTGATYAQHGSTDTVLRCGIHSERLAEPEAFAGTWKQWQRHHNISRLVGPKKLYTPQGNSLFWGFDRNSSHRLSRSYVHPWKRWNWKKLTYYKTTVLFDLKATCATPKNSVQLPRHQLRPTAATPAPPAPNNTATTARTATALFDTCVKH